MERVGRGLAAFQGPGRLGRAARRPGLAETATMARVVDMEGAGGLTEAFPNRRIVLRD